MKRIVSLTIFLLLISGTVWAGPHIRSLNGLENMKGITRMGSLLEDETEAYLALPGVSLAQAEIDSLDSIFKSLKYTSGYTHTIASTTVNISNVASYYFLSNPTYTSTGLPSNDLRWIPAGYTIRLTDTGAKVKTITKGANGTGETYGAEIFNDTSFDVTGSWAKDVGTAVAGGKGTFATVGPSQGLTQSGKSIVSGGLYKNAVTVDALSLGSLSYLFNPATQSAGMPVWTTTGAKSFYVTAVSNNSIIGVYSRSASTTGQIDDVTSKQVLTPSLTGIWYTTVSEDSGYNPNTTQIITVSK